MTDSERVQRWKEEKRNWAVMVLFNDLILRLSFGVIEGTYGIMGQRLWIIGMSS